ncbi:nucleoside deaminase [Candidatus Gromoviella agglomerans]|uniref:nucleoside deaminase n=1 Tax=Candidatus Gromoviella agglomerans TaxID=2806609 RepID=UPI001E5A99E6|nr:nucleoside deaminase [Candidatus Gromoviella agglomerans]UFX98293.1 tRNA-specific adenosine deaminase [Candidatus Gromoviella agglomerans]
MYNKFRFKARVEYKKVLSNMKKLLEFAKNSLVKDEDIYSSSVPVFAMITDLNGQVISIARNSFIEPIDHAEIIAMKCVHQKYLHNYYLFVTLEPCPMCQHAIELKRLKNVFFGAYRDFTVNNHSEFIGGICEEDCSEMIQNFFKNIRKYNESQTLITK